jgi:hypothetical protein
LIFRSLTSGFGVRACLFAIVRHGGYLPLVTIHSDSDRPQALGLPSFF